jgi:energy-coupling factor transport system permease protein
LGIYLDSPRTWLHQLDPRIKLFWLLSVLLSPLLASNLWRLLVVLALMGLTWLAALPMRVWVKQLPLAMALGILTFVLIAASPDGLGVTAQPQRQDAHIMAYGLVSANPDLAEGDSAEVLQFNWQTLPWVRGYSYVLFSQKIPVLSQVTVTRRSLSIALRVGTLFFTLLYATSLFLLTTAPEEITTGIEHLTRPLGRWGIPIAEILLTLTLAIRFLPLVLEEVQNLVRAVQTRDIRWQSLHLRGAIHTLLALVERLLENLFLRAEQTAAAMQVRGYSGPHHWVRWHVLKLQPLDWIMLGLLILFWLIRVKFFTVI